MPFNQEDELKHFNYQHPAEQIFGYGRFTEIGSIAARFGHRYLLVSGPRSGALRDLYSEAKKSLGQAGVKSQHFDGVIPNSTVETVSEGARIARGFRADVVLGIGRGSSLDPAKAIAVETTYDGSCWDYLFFKQKPTDRTLPVISVRTTAGSGSQITQVAVVTDSATRDKSALYDNHLIPQVALIDSALTLSVSGSRWSKLFVEATRCYGGRIAGAVQAVNGASRLHQKTNDPDRRSNSLDNQGILFRPH